MAKLSTLGACSLSLVGALAITACGDDPVPSGTGGTAGSAGAAAGAGSGGRAGNGGAAGSGGSAGSSAGMGGGAGVGGSGSPGDAGVDGGGPPCTGCVELRVPNPGVTGADVDTIFIFQVDPPVDFSNARITYRIKVPTLNNGQFVNVFSQDSTFDTFDSDYRTLDEAGGFIDSDDFVDIVYDLTSRPPVDLIDVPDAGDAGGSTPDPADFDKSRIAWFGLVLGAFSGAEPIIVYVDSVTFTGVARADVTFTDGTDGFVIHDFEPQPNSAIIHHP